MDKYYLEVLTRHLGERKATLFRLAPKAELGWEFSPGFLTVSIFARGKRQADCKQDFEFKDPAILTNVDNFIYLKAVKYAKI